MAVLALVLAGVTAVTTLAVVLKCCVLRTGVIAPVRRQDVEAVDAANPRPHVRLFQSLREEVTGLKLEVGWQRCWGACCVGSAQRTAGFLCAQVDVAIRGRCARATRCCGCIRRGA